MGVPYGWGLVEELGPDRLVELVRTLANEGLTERVDGRWCDVYRAPDGAVTVESADVEAFADELARGRGGTLSYDVAAALELGRCLCFEAPGLLRDARFDGYRCKDLAQVLAEAEGLLADGSPDADQLEVLVGCLARALALHVGVVFGE